MDCHIKMLQQIVDGLIAQGYVEKGGSDIWRLLEAPQEGPYLSKAVKVYLNDYNNPTHIVVRYA